MGWRWDFAALEMKGKKITKNFHLLLSLFVARETTKIQKDAFFVEDLAFSSKSALLVHFTECIQNVVLKYA